MVRLSPVLVLSACWSSPSPQPEAPAPPEPAVEEEDALEVSVAGLGMRHAIVISIDTLRADHLGCYGNDHVETPHIDGLASDGALFAHDVSVAPTTLVSHTSMMTGTWPHTHGVAWNGGIVAEENQTLAEILDARGFTTAGFIGGYPLEKRFGFAQGFEHFTDPLDTADAVTDAVLAWWDANEPARGFLFIHYWDVHHPFRAPSPWDRKYRTDSLTEVVGSNDDLQRARNAISRGDPDAAELTRALAGAYAGEVSWTDSQVGRLLDGLKARGVLDQAVLVLTADHGETMDEHPDAWTHGPSVYETAVHVPLIVHAPPIIRPGTRIATTVSSVDVMPTVLDMVGIEVPDDVEGTSLVELLVHGDGVEHPRAFSEATKPKSKPYERGVRWINERKCRGIWDGSTKLVRCPLEDRTELYDLSADPAERADLFGASPEAGERAAPLRIELEAWSGAGEGLPTRQDESEEVVDALRELGYVED